jgi:hypothetical protein
LANLFNRILLIVIASVLLAVILSVFVFSSIENDVAGLRAALKTATEEQATKEELKSRLTQTELESLAATGKLKSLATKDEVEKRLSKEDLEKRLKTDLETLAATKKALDDLNKQYALDAKANKDELEKRLTKEELEKRLKTDLETLAATKKVLDDLAKQHAIDVLTTKKEIEGLAAKKDIEGLATKQGLKDLADTTVVRKVRLERKDLQDALKFRGNLEEKDRNDHELLFSLSTTGGRGEVLANIASNFSEIDHLTVDSLQADGKPVNVKLTFKNAVLEIPEKWFIELAVYRAGATDYRMVAGAPGK